MQLAATASDDMALDDADGSLDIPAPAGALCELC